MYGYDARGGNPPRRSPSDKPGTKRFQTKDGADQRDSGETGARGEEGRGEAERDVERIARTLSATRSRASTAKRSATTDTMPASPRASGAMRRARAHRVIVIMKAMGTAVIHQLRPVRLSHREMVRSVRAASNWLEVPKTVQNIFQAG